MLCESKTAAVLLGPRCKEVETAAALLGPRCKELGTAAALVGSALQSLCCFVMLCSCLHALGCLAATVCMFVLAPRASSDSSLIVARLAQAQTVRAVSEQ